MNEMQIFQNEQFGQVRVVERDGEPWFIAVDVCKALDIADASRAMERLDDDEGGRIEIAHPQNPYKTLSVNAVNEPGLYELVLGSRKKEAREFKRWIKHEVLPSIRKTGGYVANDDMFINTYLPHADEQTRLMFRSSLETIRNLNAKIEADKPKVEFAEALETSTNSITVKQLSVLLAQRGCKTGEKRLFNELREDGFLLSYGNYYNEPAQRYMDMKLFEVKTGTYTTAYGDTRNTRQTLITPKGLQYLMDYYMRKHGKMPLLTTAQRKRV